MKRYLLFVTQLYSFSVLRPLQAAIQARGDEAKWFLFGIDDYLKEREQRLETIAEVMAYRPDAVFTCSNWVPDFFPGAKVQLFHGFNAEKREDHVGHFRIRGWFDLYCTQGPSTTSRFQLLARKHGYFRAVETGWTKVDPLFWPVAPDPQEHFEADRPVILYTSTFTPRLSAAPHLHETIARLARQGRWRWLVNLHPKMDPAIVARYRELEGEYLHFVETDDIIPLLKAAEVMVSDTSSVVFEFMLQEKPVVTFRHRNPGPHLLNIQQPEQLEQAIERALARPPALMAEVRNYVDWLHPYRDGKSAGRVLDATEHFLSEAHGKLKRKPLNLWRKLAIRRKMGHYRW